MTIHEEELYAAWNKAVRNEPFGNIEPLPVKDGIAYAGEPKQPVKTVHWTVGSSGCVSQWVT
jgi:hypothetical protein